MLWYRNDRGYCGHDMDTRGKYDKGRSRSRSPDRSTWGDRSKSFNRDRSCSRSPDKHDRAVPHQHSQGYSFHNAMMERKGGNDDRAPPVREHSPVVSFHQSLIERGQSSPPSRQQQQQRVPPYNSDSCKDYKGSRYTHSSYRTSSPSSPGREWGGSPRNRLDDGRYGGSYSSHHGEEEEGMIPDEPQDDALYGVAD